MSRCRVMLPLPHAITQAEFFAFLLIILADLVAGMLIPVAKLQVPRSVGYFGGFCMLLWHFVAEFFSACLLDFFGVCFLGCCSCGDVTLIWDGFCYSFHRLPLWSRLCCSCADSNGICSKHNRGNTWNSKKKRTGSTIEHRKQRKQKLYTNHNNNNNNHSLRFKHNNHSSAFGALGPCPRLRGEPVTSTDSKTRKLTQLTQLTPKLNARCVKRTPRSTQSPVLCSGLAALTQHDPT